MASIRYFLCLCIIVFASISADARDYVNEPTIHWPKDGRFDFCADSKQFDYRNAYWLAAMSYYSYWHPAYLEQIFTAPLGKPLKLKLQGPNGLPNGTAETYGLGWKGHVDFFTSASLHPHSPKTYNDHHASYFTAPLPAEACVKREKQWCFGATLHGHRGQMEINECGQNLELALMTKERLHNVNELVRGIEQNPVIRKQAQIDKKVIEHYVRGYEEKKQIDLGLDFTDPRFEERCEIYRVDTDLTPDVQAIWVESSELVIVAFRGTEQDNIIDWTTDLATAFQLNHKYLPFWKRNVHKGYEHSLEIMSDWLQSEVNQLFKRYPEASKIPIFLTGHSMGGALATLVMTAWLDRNQKVSNDLRLNLKSVYTFGSPRIGNLDFAHTFEKLNISERVGVFRMVNNKDVVTKAPCLDYSHFGTNVQLLTPEDGPSPSTQVAVMVNPRPSDDYNYCAWGPSILDNLFNFKKYARDHYLESYYSALSTTRSELQRSLRIEEINYTNKNGRLNAPPNPYQFPANCRKVSIQTNNAPAYLKYNYEPLLFEIEN
jgi:hypothetical protein